MKEPNQIIHGKGLFVSKGRSDSLARFIQIEKKVFSKRALLTGVRSSGAFSF